MRTVVEEQRPDGKVRSDPDPCSRYAGVDALFQVIAAERDMHQMPSVVKEF